MSLSVVMIYGRCCTWFYFIKNREIYIENLRFWSIRNEQKSETENDNDWKINRSFLLGLPCKFKYWNQKKIYNKNY